MKSAGSREFRGRNLTTGHEDDDANNGHQDEMSCCERPKSHFSLCNAHFILPKYQAVNNSSKNP